MNRQRRFILAILLALAIRSHGVARSVKIGAIFHKGDEDYISTFHRAIAETKHKHVAHALELVPVFEIVDADTDSFKTAASVCKLLEQGVAAIFGPASPHTRGIVASIAARYDVPHIDYVWRESEKLSTDDTSKSSSSMTINVFPDNEMLSQAIANVVNSTGWESFIAIYENDDGLSRIQKTLTLKHKEGHSMIQTVRQLHGHDTDKKDYRPMLKEIKLFPVCNIIIDVEPRNLIEVLKQAKEVKLLTEYCNFIITYLVRRAHRSLHFLRKDTVVFQHSRT